MNIIQTLASYDKNEFEMWIRNSIENPIYFDDPQSIYQQALQTNNPLMIESIALIIGRGKDYSKFGDDHIDDYQLIGTQIIKNYL